MTGRVVCFGEVLLRLKAPGFERLFQTPTFEATFGGAEANVAVSLARLGLAADAVTAVPAHDAGDAALAALRRHGVSLTHVARCGSRLGLYYLEAGAGPRGARVVYDRAGSSLATAPPGTFDWPAILDGARWLHVSGITPALSATAAQHTLDACRAARAGGVTVSCDLNHRAALWQYGAAPTDVMPAIVAETDVLIGGREDCGKALGITVAGDSGFDSLTAQVRARFPTLSVIALTLRETRGAGDYDWSACLRDAQGFHVSRRHVLTHVVDRVGAGDAFAAGLIFALARGDDGARALEFATAAGALKHTIPGDFNLVGTAEIETLAGGEASGRIQR